jgi:glycerophosphoryl diester phosphodiesterase
MISGCSASERAASPGPTAPAAGELDSSATTRATEHTRPAPRGGPAIDLQGHRGARGLYPENTIVGIHGALAIGVSTLELDLGMSADGVVVVHHDERLNPDTTRDADGHWLEHPTPALHELPWSELARYDVGRLRPGTAYHRRFSTQRAHDGQRIPRLVDVLHAAEQRSGGTIRYNLETKLTPTMPHLSRAPEEIANAVVRLLIEAGVERRSTVQSFDWRTLRVLAATTPELATSCLTTEEPGSDTIERGKSGASAWTAGLDVDDHGGSVPRLVRAASCTTWSPDLRDLDAKQLAEAHQEGLRVVVWTVNRPEDVNAALELGVDGIISDYPNRVRAELERRALPLPPRHGPETSGSQ